MVDGFRRGEEGIYLPTSLSIWVSFSSSPCFLFPLSQTPLYSFHFFFSFPFFLSNPIISTQLNSTQLYSTLLCSTLLYSTHFDPLNPPFVVFFFYLFVFLLPFTPRESRSIPHSFVVRVSARVSPMASFSAIGVSGVGPSSTSFKTRDLPFSPRSLSFSSTISGEKITSKASSGSHRRAPVIVSPKAVSDSRNGQTCLDPDASRVSHSLTLSPSELFLGVLFYERIVGFAMCVMVLVCRL